MPAGLRESVDTLDAMIADGEATGFGTRYDTEILAALKELRAHRRGEFVCSRCGVHQEGEQTEVEF